MNLFLPLKVLPSQRQGIKTKLYGVWVCLHKHHGWALTGNCTCMAGLGSACSHVAAVLFKLEAAVHFELNKPTASTSMLCSWKQPKRNVQPSPAALINFARPKKNSLPTEQKAKEFSPFEDPNLYQHGISKESFKELYCINPHSAIFSSVDTSQLTGEETMMKSFVVLEQNVYNESDTDSDTENEYNVIPEPLTSLFDPTAINMSKDELTCHSKRIYDSYAKSYSQKSYNNLCDLTKSQALSPAWMLHRAGRITASVCSQVFHMRDSKSLICKIMQYNGDFTSKYTQHGKELEPKAREQFILEQSKKHINFNLCESGRVIDAEIPYLGASPDGIVSCSCHGKGVLEIKCPYKYKDSLNCWEHDNEFPIEKGTLLMKRNHKYYYQVQLQIELCRVDFAYFYVFSSSSKESLSIVVPKDKEFIGIVLKTLKEKFFRAILPEIVSRNSDINSTNDRKLHCLCRRPEFGPMIACDNKSCKVEWYHYPCVNITRAPKRKWYCKECKKNNSS